MPATTRKNTPRLRDGVMKRGSTWSGSQPRARQSLAYWMAEDSVSPIASAGVAPACCMC